MDRIDICIIGAGVAGLALARQLALTFPHLEIALLEQHDQPGEETSSRNSEVIHAGIYYPPASLKARYCAEGSSLLYDYCREHRIDCRRVGKLIVAQQGEEAELQRILDNARACNVNSLLSLDQAQIKKLEPAIQASAALFSPATGILDSHGYMQSLLAQAQSAGVMFARRTKFVSAAQVPDPDHGRLFCVRFTTDQSSDVDEFACRLLINCAGLAARRLVMSVEHELSGLVLPAVNFIKGNYFSYDGKSPFNHLIYPVPETGGRGLGIHATVDLGGQCRFGPDVEPVEDESYAVDPGRRQRFAAAVSRYYPSLDEKRLTPAYSGIRTRAEGVDGTADFRICQELSTAPGVIHMLGIESPGLTASLAMAADISCQISESGLLD